VTGGDAAERRARLLGVKLSALVGSRATGAPVLHPFPLGAAALVDGEAWVLIADAGDDGRGLGAALAWSLRRDVQALHVVTERGAGVMARRAIEFTLPISVWEPDGAELTLAVAEPAGLRADPDPRHLELLADIEASGATPLVEQAVVAGEVRGLEVCRVVSAPDDDGGTAIRLEVGVGAHDREAFAMIHGDRPGPEALADVVATVGRARDVGAPAHPLNRLAPERFLRWRLEQDPSVLGLASLAPMEPPVPRLNLKDVSPCTALGRRADGAPVVVVTSVGVDLDVIPYAADARRSTLAGFEPGIGGRTPVGGLEVLVVAPSRDLVRVTHELAAALRHPVTLVPSPLSA